MSGVGSLAEGKVASRAGDNVASRTERRDDSIDSDRDGFLEADIDLKGDFDLVRGDWARLGSAVVNGSRLTVGLPDLTAEDSRTGGMGGRDGFPTPGSLIFVLSNR